MDTGSIPEPEGNVHNRRENLVGVQNYNITQFTYKLKWTDSVWAVLVIVFNMLRYMGLQGQQGIIFGYNL